MFLSCSTEDWSDIPLPYENKHIEANDQTKQNYTWEIVSSSKDSKIKSKSSRVRRRIRPSLSFTHFLEDEVLSASTHHPLLTSNLLTLIAGRMHWFTFWRIITPLNSISTVFSGIILSRYLHKQEVTAKRTLIVVKRSHIVNGAFPFMILFSFIVKAFGASPEKLLSAEYRCFICIDTGISFFVEKFHQMVISTQLGGVRHLPSTTDRTLCIMGTSSVVDRTLVVMSIWTNPPHAFGRALGDGFGCQVSIPTVIPFGSEIWTTDG